MSTGGGGVVIASTGVSELEMSLVSGGGARTGTVKTEPILGTTIKSKIVPQDQVTAWIDPSKCINCGTCRENCPADAITEQQRQICRICPTCTGRPGMSVGKMKSLPAETSCTTKCPLGISPQGYLGLTKIGKYEEAYEMIWKKNPLPAVCARVCHHPCEEGCKRGILVDEPLKIREIKRYLSEKTDYHPAKYQVIYEEKIAVVGAGPSGSSAAFYCVKHGLDVLLIDKEPWPRDKVCGDAWLPSLKPILTEMGIYEEMKSLNTVSGGDDFFLASPDGTVVEYSMGGHANAEGPSTFVIPRRIGDDVVRRAAVKAGAEFIDNFEATELIIRRGKVCGIRGYNHNVFTEIEADAVIVANGSHSMLARQVGIFNEDPSLSMFAARQYFKNLPPMLKPGTVFQFYLPEQIPNYEKARKSMSFGWITMQDEPGCGTLGMVIPIETIEALDMSLEEVYKWIVTQSPTIAPFFEGAEPVDELKGWRLLGSTSVNKNYVRGALFIGDANSQAECAHFYGIPVGMMSGQIAAALLDDIFTTGNDSEESYGRFHKICADRFNAQYEFYSQFRSLVHENIENVNEMNKYARELFPDSKPVYSIVMYKYVTEVLGKSMPTPPPADKRLSQ